ncbi:hypothetical protein LX64_04421 [Chitinophaga skermanii]|uniref:Uncharacterized protein n=1 Tax=Chitinophaga skermanii TaxID=331697 RepID=A0A327Q7U1_9BACT|nr:hypothetical protein [Chitinophaga skermanii]RAI99867.1 hypothetical protein LX64_04421 [Chitinophaga skermanii]
MENAPTYIKEMFIHAKVGLISKENFEAWLYQNKELPSLLTEDDYLELIPFPFKSAHATDFFQLIDKFIIPADFACYSLLSKLNEALDRNKHPGILHDFYSLFRDGYSFMEKLGLEYGIEYFESCVRVGIDSPETKKIVAEYFPSFVLEIVKIKALLETRQIVIVGESNVGTYSYADYRH